MPNPAIQRLMEASAAPMRGKARIGSTAIPKIGGIGVPEIAGAQPVSSIIKPVSSLKPMGPNEWYSDDYAAASQSWSSSKGLPGYQPPDFGTPEFTQYFEYTKGVGAYPKFEANLLTQYAPTFSKALKSSSLFDKSVAAAIKQGKSLTEVFELITTKPIPTALTIEQQNAAATKLFNEYSDATSKASEFLGKSDPNYRFKLPDPKFKYGATTNFKAGTIDVLNNYWAYSKYKTYEQQLTNSGKYTPAQISQALNNAKTQLATVVTKSGATPFNDEKARRDALKKGK